MKYLCPTMMTGLPEETDKETFLDLMLQKRPEYAIVWDVHGEDVIEFLNRVWVVNYIVVSGDTAYYSEKKYYAKRAKKLFRLDKIVEVESPEEWKKYLPKGEKFKRIRYWSPSVVDEITEIDMEDFINKMIEIRPPFVVLWNVSLEDVEYMASRVYVVSYMPVIGNTIHYSYGKYFAIQAMEKFNIPRKQKIDIQMPSFIENS